MNIARVDRKGFVSWIGSSDGLFDKLPPSTAIEGGAGVVSVADFGNGIPTIAVRSSEMREFVAFLTTYIGNYTPFTAFFRLVPEEMLSFIPTRPMDIEGPLLKGVIGVVIVDALVNSGGVATRIGDIGLAASLATSSMVAVIALNLGYTGAMVEVALQRWATVRESLGIANDRSEKSNVRRLWNNLLAGINNNDEVSDNHDLTVSAFVREIIERSRTGGDGPPSALKFVFRDYGGISDVVRMSREERIRVLDRAVDELDRAHRRPEDIEVAVGWLISLVGQGAFSYLTLAMRYQSRYPMVPYWFAFFAGLRAESDVLVVGDCLGRRLCNKVDVAKQTVGVVDADCGFEELLTLVRETRGAKFRVERPSAFKIELLPGVCGVFRNAESSSRGQARDVRREEAESRLQHARELASQLMSTLSMSPSSVVGGQSGAVVNPKSSSSLPAPELFRLSPEKAKKQRVSRKRITSS